MSGARGTRPAWAPLLPSMLRAQGYRCYHSGKWHIDGLPLQNGFDHSYSLEDHDRHFAPRRHTLDDVALPPVAAGSGYYTSTAFADHAIKCLQEHDRIFSGRPFFTYLAFTAPHFPLQAPAEDIARYHDKYARGWDVMRGERWQRLQQIGIGGSGSRRSSASLARLMSSRHPAKIGPNEINRPLPWEELTESQRVFQAEKMAVHAAMVDRMDGEIGRVLAQIHSMKGSENTLIFFLSDNGASAEMMIRGDGHDPAARLRDGRDFPLPGPGLVEHGQHSVPPPQDLGA